MEVNNRGKHSRLILENKGMCAVERKKGEKMKKKGTIMDF